MQASELNEGYGIFGNKGAVVSDECHIFRYGFDSETLCGTPMLSTNWAKVEGVTHIGCKSCIKEYKDETSS